MDIIMIGEVREKTTVQKYTGHETMQTLWTKPALLEVEKTFIKIQQDKVISLEDQNDIYNMTSKQEIIEKLKENGTFLLYVADHFKNDESIIKTVMKNNVYDLQYAINNIRSNADIILEAVKSKEEMYHDLIFQTCASESLKQEAGDTNVIYYLEKKIFNNKLQNSIPEKLEDNKSNLKIKI